MDSNEAIPRPAGALERTGTVGAAALFSLALSIASVGVPLLIVQAGYGVAEVGFLVALSSITQMGVRLRIGALMRRVPDKRLVGMAAALMALGSALLVVSTEVWGIVVSQLLQGAARGLFWTGIHTHAVRTASAAARGLAAVNLASGVGLMLGPALAGLLLESSAGVAMAAASLAAGMVLVPVAAMARTPVLPPPDRRRTERRTSRPGVRAGSWAAASAGAWRGLMGSYVPVALHQATHSSTTIGTVVGLANAATVGAGWAGRWVPVGQFAAALVFGITATGLGLAAFGLSAEVPVLAGGALVLSGAGMGLLQTIGPALAAESVHPDQRGDAIAAVGLYRAGATFVAPFGVAALVLVLPLGYALLTAGALVALPSTYALRQRRN